MTPPGHIELEVIGGDEPTHGVEFEVLTGDEPDATVAP